MAFILFAMSAIGCTATVLTPLDQMTHEQKLSRGQRLYEKKCASCHALKDPMIYSDTELSAATEKYGTEKGLTRREKDLVKYYLVLANNKATTGATPVTPMGGALSGGTQVAHQDNHRVISDQ